MNGEQTAVIDGMPGKQNQPMAAAQPLKPPPPHFDETAVADAQPVEPLPPTRHSLANLSLTPLMIVVAFGLVLILVSVATGFLIARSDHAAATEAATGAAQPSQPAEPVPAKTTPTVFEPVTAAATAAGNTDNRSRRSRKVVHRVRPQNLTVPVLAEEEGRPTARKVGEIRYGRSPDRP